MTDTTDRVQVLISCFLESKGAQILFAERKSQQRFQELFQGKDCRIPDLYSDDPQALISYVKEARCDISWKHISLDVSVYDLLGDDFGKGIDRYYSPNDKRMIDIKVQELFNTSSRNLRHMHRAGKVFKYVVFLRGISIDQLQDARILPHLHSNLSYAKTSELDNMSADQILSILRLSAEKFESLIKALRAQSRPRYYRKMRASGLQYPTGGENANRCYDKTVGIQTLSPPIDAQAVDIPEDLISAVMDAQSHFPNVYIMKTTCPDDVTDLQLNSDRLRAEQLESRVRRGLDVFLPWTWDRPSGPHFAGELKAAISLFEEDDALHSVMLGIAAIQTEEKCKPNYHKRRGGHKRWFHDAFGVPEGSVGYYKALGRTVLAYFPIIAKAWKSTNDCVSSLLYLQKALDRHPHQEVWLYFGTLLADDFRCYARDSAEVWAKRHAEKNTERRAKAIRLIREQDLDLQSAEGFFVVGFVNPVNTRTLELLYTKTIRTQELDGEHETEATA